MTESTSVPIRYRNGWRLRSGNWFPWYLFLPWAVASFCGVIMLFYVIASTASNTTSHNLQWSVYGAELEVTKTTNAFRNASGGWSG